ncbi:hypothetical protein N7526_002682 [Penicillium atrosanguineum]|nr:hypothetical protein N7526_002682 [Penicillium atrosanguineum]
MSSRVGFRFLNSTRFAFRNASAPFRRPGAQGFRFSSTEAGADAAKQSTFQRMWNSPVGVKTVHFWAPVMKWCLVIAGMADFARPAEKLSLTQNAALMGTGAIWTRWCMIIKPRNVLAARGGGSVEAVKEMEQDAVDSVKAVANAAEGAAEKAEKKIAEKTA